MEKQSAEAHRDYRQSREKFDYFITGVSIAICGYLVQIYDASGLKSGSYISILELVSICFFLVTIFCSFRRMETMITGKKKNSDYLRENERIGDISRSAVSGKTIMFDGEVADKKKVLDEIDNIDARILGLVSELNNNHDVAFNYYKARNWAFLSGAIAQFVANILSGVM